MHRGPSSGEGQSAVGKLCCMRTERNGGGAADHHPARVELRTVTGAHEELIREAGDGTPLMSADRRKGSERVLAGSCHQPRVSDACTSAMPPVAASGELASIVTATTPFASTPFAIGSEEADPPLGEVVRSRRRNRSGPCRRQRPREFDRLRYRTHDVYGSARERIHEVT